MAYVALYRAYRPQTFKEVCGQEHIVHTLKNAIINNKVAHAYLFCGPRGTGKTTIAKIMAKAMNCPNQEDGEPCNECDICKGINKGMITDIVEIDAASNNGVDEIREIRDKVKYLPSEGKYKVYIIDEVHMLSTGAFNALLKTLEEPPMHVIFILATTEPQKIPATILSRCQRFDFRGVSNKEIMERINFIAKEENIIIEQDAVRLIAECAEGGMRDALSLLDEAISYSSDKVCAKDVYQVSGSVDLDNIIKLSECILSKDAANTLKALEAIVELGKEIPKICNDLIAFYRDMLLYKSDHKADKGIYENPAFITLSRKTSNQKLYFYLNVLNEAQNNMKFTNQKRTYLELALVKMSDHIEQISVDNTEQINKLEQRIKELEQKIKTLQFAPVMASSNIQIEEEVVPVEQVRNNNYNYIEIGMIAEVLYNGNINTKKLLIKKLEEIKTLKKERVLINTIAQASVVACGNNKAIITLEQTPQCDFVMRKEQKRKLLTLFNEEGCLIDDYYAIPKNIWDDILSNYSQQYKAGIKRPVLKEVYIDVRLYNEEESSESEMKKITHEIFGDLVKFEE